MNPAPIYPFAALVGQEQTKLALLLCAVEPRISGVLLRGEKGTAKSTAVRGLAQLLPPQPSGEPARVHTVPLNATEDRLAGGLDLEQTVATGEPHFAPGILAAADQQILYVDEVNLLDDHLVDIILDAASSGVNRVEREGFSLQHPARFALVGTMNPEEGSLRPQVTDRFGLCVDLVSEPDPQQRVELMLRRESYDQDPLAFCDTWHTQTTNLKSQIRAAQTLLPNVRVDQHVTVAIAELAQAAHAAGHRSDIVMTHATRAHAAWQGRDTASLDDVLAVSDMVLAHRRREVAPPSQSPPQNQQPPPNQDNESPADPTSDDTPADDQAPEPETHQNQPAENDGTSPHVEGEPDIDEQETSPDTEQDEHTEQAEESAEADDSPADLPPIVPAVGQSYNVKNLAPTKDRLARRGSGRRQVTRSATRRGRYIRSRPARTGDDLALDATMRAAAVHQRSRRAQHPERAFVMERSDWQQKVRENKVGTCIVFVVDASGSMGAQGRMTATKGAILSLLMDAYQKRDRVAMVAFRRDRAETLLPPTSSVEVANSILTELPVGGRTPLAAGLAEAHKVVTPLLRKEPNLRPLVVVISDGRGNVRLDGSKGSGTAEVHQVAQKLGDDPRVQWVVVDSEARRGMQLGLAVGLAEALQAPRFALEDLKAQDLVNVVKGHA